MRPFLSEFSYGYALTEELASGVFGSLVAAPIFPSLIQEGQPGGGYDLQLPLAGAPLFLQFKLSDRMVYKSAAEWHIFNQAYYRMHLRPARHSDQHQLLCTLEASGEEVYYVAPYFHKMEELNVHYTARSVHNNSAWFRPSDIGVLPDNDDHYLVFEQHASIAYFCSNEPRPMEGKLTSEFVASRQRINLRENGKPLDKQFFTNIANEILAISEFSKEASPELMTERFGSARRRTRKQEAKFAAYLSRTLLNAELMIIADQTAS